MLTSVYSAARHLCAKSAHSLSDLELYRFLYVAQMTHLGLHDRPIFNESFEAWEFGPVQPDLYNEINTEGESELRKVLKAASKMRDGSEKDILDQTYDLACQADGDWLVAVTHWELGAWAKSYDEARPHAVIEHELMRQEYMDRLSAEKQERLRKAS